VPSVETSIAATSPLPAIRASVRNRSTGAAVWGGAYLGDRAALHATVKRLRRKLAALPNGPRVRTVRGVGYHLVPG